MTTSTLTEHVRQMDAHDLYTGLTVLHDGEWRTIASTERVHRRVRVVFEDGREARLPAMMIAHVLAPDTEHRS